MEAKMKILVIDDHEGTREFLTLVLEGMGHQVLLAKNGPGGIEIIKQNSDNLDLVITDRKMPGMLGEEVVRSVKRDYPHIRVILMSSYVDDALVSVAKAAGADLVMQKLGHIEQIEQIIDALLKPLPKEEEK